MPAVLTPTSRSRSSLFLPLTHCLTRPLSLLTIAAALPQLKRLLAVDMSNACSSIKRILNDTLRMQKIEEGKVEMEYIPAQIKTIVKGPFKTESTVSPSIQMDLTIDPAIENEWAMLDVPRLHQVMANFLSNARKFTAARDGFPPRISVRCECTTISSEEISLRVEVEDTGAGIPPDSIESVFVPYKQVCWCGRGAATGSVLSWMSPTSPVQPPCVLTLVILTLLSHFISLPSISLPLALPPSTAPRRRAPERRWHRARPPDRQVSDRSAQRHHQLRIDDGQR